MSHTASGGIRAKCSAIDEHTIDQLDAIVLIGMIITSYAIIERTGYLSSCIFHHAKISKSSLSSKEIVSILRHLSKSDVLF